MTGEPLLWRLFQRAPLAARAACFTRYALQALLTRQRHRPKNKAVRAMGLSFNGPVGLAAGFDRYGLLAKHWCRLGFSHVELGTLTRYSEPGHNRGIDSIHNLHRRPREHGIIGVNVGINRSRSLSEVEEDLLYCQYRIWPVADYLCLNLANTAAQPLFQQPDRLHRLLTILSHNGHDLANASGHRVPLMVKIGVIPGQADLPEIIAQLEPLGAAGLLLAFDPGPPATADRLLRWLAPELQQQACTTLRQCRQMLGQQMGLLTVGGAYQPEHIHLRLDAGADLVQIHNGLLINGSPLLGELQR